MFYGSVVDPDLLNPDPDPDRKTGSSISRESEYGSRFLMTKNYKK